jgi:hypothetical protein
MMAEKRCFRGRGVGGPAVQGGVGPGRSLTDGSGPVWIVPEERDIFGMVRASPRDWGVLGWCPRGFTLA